MGALGNDEYEIMLEISDPAPENAGLYKCVVNNKYGEINANLSLNIEVAPVVRKRLLFFNVLFKEPKILMSSGTKKVTKSLPRRAADIPLKRRNLKLEMEKPLSN